MEISDYSKAANQMIRENRPDDIFVQRENAGVSAVRPAVAPTRWPHCRGAELAAPDAHGAARHGGARHGGARYDTAAANQKLSLAQHAGALRFCEGFIQELTSAFGRSIAGRCMRAIDGKAPAPLTARSVSAVIEVAERSQQQCRNDNAATINRHFEHERGDPAHNGGKCRAGAFAELVTKFEIAYAKKRCGERPEYSQGLVTKNQMRAARREARAFVTQLRGTSGLCEEQLGVVLVQACRAESTEALRHLVQDLVAEQARISVADVLLDWRTPSSFLARTAAILVQSRGEAPLAESVLASIQKSIRETLSARLSSLPERLQCGSDTASVKAALHPLLEEKIHQAIDQQCAALKQFGHTLPAISRDLARADCDSPFGAMTVSGDFKPALHEAMSAVLESPSSHNDKERILLPGGSEVGKGFWQAANQNLRLTLVNGTPLLDRQGWRDLDEKQRMAEVEAAYKKLIVMLGEKRAQAFTQVVHRGLTKPFQSACAADPELNPLRLPDGTPITPQGVITEITEIVLVESDAEGIRLAFVYSCRNLSSALNQHTGAFLSLDPKTSAFNYRFEFRMRNDGTVQLVPLSGAYAGCLSLSSGQGSDLTSTAVDLRRGGVAMHDASAGAPREGPLERKRHDAAGGVVSLDSHRQNHVGSLEG